MVCFFISSLIGIMYGIKLNLVFLILSGLFIFLISILFFKKYSNPFIAYFIISLMFFSYTNIKIMLYNYKYEDKQNISDEFIILSVEENSAYYNKYICKNSSGDKFILQTKINDNLVFKIRDKVYIEGIFNLPDLNRYKGGFNYRRYLNSKNVYGTITAKGSSIMILERGKINFIISIKQNIEETFLKLLPKDHAGIINGMLNGDTKNISKDIIEKFKNSGITHLLAVSGSNVAYVVALFSLCSNKIFGKYLAYYIVIISIIIFIFVSGASASVARAGIMAILNIGAILFSQKSNTINNILFSAIILLIINPLLIYDVGFILSFVGTLGIVLISPIILLKLEKIIRIKFLRETIGVTLSAQIMLLPIMAYYFNSISLVSLITNLLVVPISGFLTILGFITVIISNINIEIGRLVAYAIYSLVCFVIKIASIFSNISWVNVIVPTPKVWMIVFYYLIFFLSIIDIKKEVLLDFNDFKLNLKLKKAIFSTIVIFILIFNLMNLLPKNYIKLDMIDVGQGDSFYIESQNGKVILFDGGGSESSDYDVGENILLPYLLDQGKTKIDLIIISHPHEDHIEGIFTIIEKLKVKKVVIGKNLNENELIITLKKLCEKRKTEIIEVAADDYFEIDNIYFKVIYPNLKTKEENINNLSLVIKMKFGEIKVLFTGDLEEASEESINTDIRADILKVGHHGSKTSTSEEFLKKVLPKIALISVGKDNSYGHPNKEVIERLEKIETKIYRTDEIGEVRLKIKKDKISIQPFDRR